MADFQITETFPWQPFIPTHTLTSNSNDAKNSLKGPNNTRKNIEKVNNPEENQNQVDKFSNSDKNLDSNPDLNASLDKANNSRVDVYQYGIILMKPKKKHFCPYPECKKEFCKPSQLKIHVDTVHLKLKPHKCDECGEAFGRKEHLKRHIDTVHLKLKNFICKFCDESFGTQSYLNSHIALFHENISIFSCKECEEKFTSQYKLDTHHSIEHERHEHECPECGRTFKRKGDLNRHINTVHMKLKPHKCHICCREAFTQKASLERHIKSVHENIRDHVCDICKEAFHTLGNLNSHIRQVHLEERNHKCPLCDEQFFRSAGLKQHISTIHRDQKQEIMTTEGPRLKRVFPKPSVVAYKKGKSLINLLVRAKINTKRSNRKQPNGFFRCSKNKFFKMCKVCSLIPEGGIKTHKCNRNNKIYTINSHVTCVTENVIYRITCKKPQCADFVYIGQTKRKFRDRFSDHRGYFKREKLDQVCGDHFNKPGHNYEDMLPVIIEQVQPKHDDDLRLKREKHWINTYESKEFGANRLS